MGFRFNTIQIPGAAQIQAPWLLGRDEPTQARCGHIWRSRSRTTESLRHSDGTYVSTFYGSSGVNPAPGATAIAAPLEHAEPGPRTPNAKPGTIRISRRITRLAGIRVRRVVQQEFRRSAIPCQPPLISIEASVGMPPRMLATASATASNAPSTVTVNATM